MQGSLYITVLIAMFTKYIDITSSHKRHGTPQLVRLSERKSNVKTATAALRWYNDTSHMFQNSFALAHWQLRF